MPSYSNTRNMRPELEYRTFAKTAYIIGETRTPNSHHFRINNLFQLIAQAQCIQHFADCSII